MNEKLYSRRAILSAVGASTLSGCTESLVSESESVTLSDRWQTRLPGVLSSPTTAGQTTLLTGRKPRSQDGYLVALSIEDGTKRWRIENLPTPATGAVHDGNATWMLTVTGELLVCRSGRVVDSVSLPIDEVLPPLPAISHPENGAAIEMGNETVLVGTPNGSVVAVDVSSRSVNWALDLDGEAVSPTATATNIYTAFSRGEDGYLRAYGRAQKTEQWTHSTPDSPLTRPVETRDTVFTASIHGNSGLVALDARSGEKRSTEWVNPASAPPIVSFERVYLSHLSGMSAFDPIDRTIEWQVTPAETRVETPPAVGKESLFLTTTGGPRNVVQRIDPETGTVTGEYRITADGDVSAPAYQNRAVLFKITDQPQRSGVYCLDAD